jgi:uncharacterized protein YndB with AHSA1/START domain
MSVATDTRSIVVERLMPHPPEKVWRALTSAPLMSEWLMQTDFEPVLGRRFTFRSEPVNGWNGVVACEVLAIEPSRRLVYSWNGYGEQAATGIRSVVTWTLTLADGGGTHLHMEHAGFGPNDEGFYKGASYGWPLMIETLERVAGGL